MNQQVNLYHPIFRRQEKKFSALAMLQSGAVVLAAIALLYGYSAWKTGGLREQLRVTEREHIAATGQLQSLALQVAARRADPALEQEVGRIEALLAVGDRVRELLARETARGFSGYSEYLAAFARQHLPGLWLTGFTIRGAGADLDIRGRSITPELLPQYLQKLAQERPLAGARFENFQMSRPAGKDVYFIEFAVTTAAATKPKLQ